jgi:hypothetical protein
VRSAIRAKEEKKESPGGRKPATPRPPEAYGDRPAAEDRRVRLLAGEEDTTRRDEDGAVGPARLLLVRLPAPAHPDRCEAAATRPVDAGATFSPIATERCAATCGPERRVNAKGFVLVSARWPARRSTGIAVRARPNDRRQFRARVCRVGRVRFPCSRPHQSTVPASFPAPPHEVGTIHTKANGATSGAVLSAEIGATPAGLGGIAQRGYVGRRRVGSR